MADEVPYSDEDLVPEEAEKRNWLGIGIAVLVIVIICTLIITSVILLTPRDEGGEITGARISLETSLSDYFHPRLFNGSWISDTEMCFRDADGDFVRYDIKTHQKILLLANSIFGQYGIEGFSLSPDGKYVLFSHEIRKISSYMKKAKYKIYNTATEYVSALAPATDPKAELQFATWGTTGNQVAFVYGNDIYYLHHVRDKPREIMKTGKEGIIYNGIPDWLYGVEILKQDYALWFSPDGTRLLFASFDDSGVTPISYLKYGSYLDFGNINPEIVNLHYPRAGGELPRASLWVADLKNFPEFPPPKQIQEPRELQKKDHYFKGVKWIDRNRVSILWVTRSFNLSLVTICDVEWNYACEQHVEELQSAFGPSVLYDTPVFASDKRHYFLKLPLKDEDDASYRHIAAIKVEGNGRHFLTEGKFDVISILNHCEEDKSLFFIGTREGRPGERHVYSVTDLESESPRQVRCLTCDLDEERCLYNSALLSPSCEHYILECLGPGVPKTEVRQVRADQLDNATLQVILEENALLQERVDEHAFPPVRTFTVPLLSGFEAHVRMYLPPLLKENEITQYPLVVHMDGSPGSQLITEQFKVHWGHYLASKKEYIYLQVDAGGSCCQGDKNLHAIHKKLGIIEIEDQLEVIRHLRNELPFIDPERTSVWGWGYGGYSAINALIGDPDLFFCGMAVAPVSNWLYYDAAFTERYLGDPWLEDNFAHYERADLIKKMGGIKGKMLFLAHGTADDVVHLQHSMMLLKALNDLDISYRTQLYPDQDHSLEQSLTHLRLTMDEFLENCYKVYGKTYEMMKLKQRMKGR